MSRFADDADYLRTTQYRDDRNLNARVALHDHYSTNPSGWFPWLARRLDFDADARILEIGCGPALLWREVGADLPAWDLTLTDFSEGMIEAARAGLTAPRQRITFGVVDARAIPYPDADFDVVVANHMLYHVPDRPAAFREITRVLRPGGVLVAATNGADHMCELNDLVGRFAPDEPRHDRVFARNFSLESGADQMREYFGRVEVCRYEDALRVTDCEPLIAYVTATWTDVDWTHHIEAMRTAIAEQVDRFGAFTIRKSPGILRGSEPRIA